MLDNRTRSIVVLVLVTTVSLWVGGCAQTQTQCNPWGQRSLSAGPVTKCCPAVDLGYDLDPSSTLSDVQVKAILDQAEMAAAQEPSLVRVDSHGHEQTTRMHIVVLDRTGRTLGRRSMTDAWAGSLSIAKAKAFTAMAFSSDENALSTRSIGALSQPGGPLWQIGNVNRRHGTIEFPGGLPLYKNGQLAGGIGVSGDGVEQDENVAQAGVAGFEPPAAIRIDSVTNQTVPYTN